MSFEHFPYTNFHELNLDWIIQKVKEAYSPDNPPDNVVLSVNGDTGNVVLYKNAVVRFPNVDDSTWNIFRKADGTDSGIQFISGDKAERIDGTNRYTIYDSANQPPYPVTSVNGDTGNVVSVKSLGGLTGNVIILDTSVVTESGTQKLKITFPVTTVDGATGAVTTWGANGNAVLKPPIASEGDSWGLTRDIPSGNIGIKFEYDESTDTTTGYLCFKDSTNPEVKLKILTPDDIPSSSGVVSFNGHTGAVTCTGADLAVSSTDSTKIDVALANRVISFNGSTGAVTCTGADLAVSSTDSTKINTALSTINTTLDGKAANSVITAHSETGSTATANYSAGDYILISGVLYKAKTSISSGDTFSSSNIESVTVAEELAVMNDFMTTHDKTSGATWNTTDFSGVNSKVFKAGSVVTLDINCTIETSAANTSVQLGTLPSDCRPFLQIMSTFIVGDQNVTITIDHSTGNIKYYASTSRQNWGLKALMTFSV